MELDADFSFHKLLGQLIRLHFCLSHKNLEKEGLYPGQPNLLFALYHKDGLSQKEIAEILHSKPATITVMIKRIEKAGFIKKLSDENDQRVSRIYLTEKGFKACEDLKTVIREIDNICLNNFTENEINSLKTLLEKIKFNLENHKDNNIINDKNT